MGKAVPAFEVRHAMAAADWKRIERLTASHADFAHELTGSLTRQVVPDIINAFGTQTPSSSDVLLHYADGWDANGGVPVLLVHGATSDAHCWISPYGRSHGLAAALVQAGFRVFALTFAHRHGDNLIQAAQLAHAIARLREVTGAPKVDVVAHSKGSVAVRALASGLPLPGGATYQGDIRRALLIGGPHNGIDYAFRHSSINYGLLAARLPQGYSGPMVWTRAIVMGRWIDTTNRTLMRDGKDRFPGQRQMLARWDRRYPLPRLQPDWFTTYHGGRGFVSRSPGIEKAIAQGGHLIERLNAHPLDDAIQLAVLAGNKANRVGILNEYTGPSDGTVFVESALATDAMTRGGARLLARDVLPLNHGELIYRTLAKSWIIDKLNAPDAAHWSVWSAS